MLPDGIYNTSIRDEYPPLTFTAATSWNPINKTHGSDIRTARFYILLGLAITSDSLDKYRMKYFIKWNAGAKNTEKSKTYITVHVVIAQVDVLHSFCCVDKFPVHIVGYFAAAYSTNAVNMDRSFPNNFAINVIAKFEGHANIILYKDVITINSSRPSIANMRQLISTPLV